MIYARNKNENLKTNWLMKYSNAAADLSHYFAGFNACKNLQFLKLEFTVRLIE